MENASLANQLREVRTTKEAEGNKLTKKLGYVNESQLVGVHMQTALDCKTQQCVCTYVHVWVWVGVVCDVPEVVVVLPAYPELLSMSCRR